VLAHFCLTRGARAERKTFCKEMSAATEFPYSRVDRTTKIEGVDTLNKMILGEFNGAAASTIDFNRDR
jgi:hypothetical protein